MSADIVESLNFSAGHVGASGAATLLRQAAAEIVRLRGEAEQLRVQLAGCGVIAMCNTRESLAKQMPERGAYGWSVSLEDCRNAVEREIALRERLASIAPAEAKVDAPERCGECRHTTFERRHDGSHICVHCKAIAPPPADGGAVAFDYTDIANRAQEVTGFSIWPRTAKAVLDAAGYTNPPAAQECHMRERCDCLGACKIGLGGNGAKPAAQVQQDDARKLAIGIVGAAVAAGILPEDTGPKTGPELLHLCECLGDAATHPAGDALGAVRDGYYLASFKQSRPGHPVLWWAPDNRGYTTDLRQAGIYTEIDPGYHDSEYTVPVPVAFVQSLRIRHEVDPGDSVNTMFWSAEKLRAALQHRGDSRGGEG